METFLGALGTVVAVFVMLRMERNDLRAELRDLRTELRSEIRSQGEKVDRVFVELLHHLQQGHPPHQAA